MPSRNLKYLVTGFAVVAVVAVAMNWVAKLEAAPSQSRLVAQSELIKQASMVDRSRKGDRLNHVAPATSTAMPTGCDSPFSPLAKLAPSNFIGRCLT